MDDNRATPLVLQRSKKDDNDMQPIIFKYKKKKQKKAKVSAENDDNPRYSKGLKDAQKMEGDLVRIAKRSSSAVTKGIESYDKARKKSAKSKKDGAIEDMPHNLTKAMSDSLKEASDIPVDIVDSVMTKNYRKQLRRSVKRTSRVLNIFRL